MKAKRGASGAMALSLLLVLTIITLAVALMLLAICQCTIRCFRPQNSKGAAWFMSKDGVERLVRGPWEGGDGWLKPKEDAAPVAPAAPAALAPPAALPAIPVAS